MVSAAGAEIGERQMSGAGELNAGGDEGGIEIEDGTQLDLNTELHRGGRERLAVQDPSAALRKGGGKGRQQIVPFIVTEALDINGLHCVFLPPRLEASADRLFIGEAAWKRDRQTALWSCDGGVTYGNSL